MSTDAARLFVLGSFVQACCADVARLPQPGESLRATRFTAEPGGKGFNVAVGARRQGATVGCLVAIGEDAFGALAEAAFDVAGLTTRLIRRYPVPTGAGVGLIGPAGETLVAVAPGANLSLSVADVHAAEAEIAAADVVTAQFEIDEAPIVAAFEIARRAGRRTVLNPSPFHAPSDALLAATTVVIVNEREAWDLAAALGVEGGFLSESAVTGLREALFARGPELLVVTLGAQGATACRRDADEIVRQPAFKVAAIDTLGAGDAFVAAFAVALARDYALGDIMRRAAAAGAIVAARAGVFGSMPTSAEIDHLAAP
jgi:ribokinase